MVAHLLEKEKVNPDGGIQENWWQEDVKEQLVGPDAQPERNAIPQPPQIKGEHEPLQDAACTQPQPELRQ